MAYPVGEILYSTNSANQPVAVGSISTFYKSDEAASTDTVDVNGAYGVNPSATAS